MEFNIDYTIFLVLVIIVILTLTFFMLCIIHNKIEDICTLIEVNDNLDKTYLGLPLGFEKVEGLNFSFCKRYVYVKNFIANDEYFICDTKTGQLVKVNLDPEYVDAIQKHFKSGNHATL